MICRYITVCSLGLLLALPAGAAPVDSGELARCHAMATRDERLDCYEALAVAAQSAPTARAAATPTGAAAASASHPGPSESDAPSSAGPTAQGASRTAANVAPTSQVPGAPANSSPVAQSSAGTAHSADPNDPANFGLTRRQVEPHPGGAPSSVKSTVDQITENRLHKITVVLDNGQTWSFIEPDPRLRPGDSVTIKRASLGSFLMVTPSRRSFRVERVK